MRTPEDGGRVGPEGAPAESGEMPEAPHAQDPDHQPPGEEHGGDEPQATDSRPGRARRRRSGKANLRRQWRRGLDGDRVTCVVRSIPEDPVAFYAPDVLDGLDRETWDAVDEPWEAASIALGATIAGRLSGAVLGLVPDRHRWRAFVYLPGEGGRLSREAWREPARCLVAARARLAAAVVDEARIWRAAERLGLDDDTMLDVVRHLSRKSSSAGALETDAAAGRTA